MVTSERVAILVPSVGSESQLGRIATPLKQVTAQLQLAGKMLKILSKRAERES